MILHVIIFFFSVLQTVHGSCPLSYELVRDGECRGCDVGAQTILYSDVIRTIVDKCNHVQGQPIIIHNEEHQSFWRQRSLKQISPYAVGLSCNWKTKRWEWTDGSSVDYKPPTYDSELDGECKSTCIWQINYYGHWYISCDQGKPALVDICCTTQLEQPHCEGFDENNADEPCYQVGEREETWQDAQKTCRNLGADLASIHTTKDNSFVRRLAVSNGNVKGLFLGATIEGKGNDFGWIDGTSWDYQNFYAGFPVSGLGECVVLDTEGTTGQWVNTDCDRRYSFVCVSQPKEPACAVGPWKEGEAILTPGFPFNASVPCDYMLSVEPGKKVQVQVEFIEANSCCDQLILYDGYVGGDQIANYTGYGTYLNAKTGYSNFMRVSWKPNGGVNVRGAVFSFIGV